MNAVTQSNYFQRRIKEENRLDESVSRQKLNTINISEEIIMILV